MTSHLPERRWTVIASGIFLALGSVVPAWAQEPAAAEPAADDTVALATQHVITPEAQAVLNRMSGTFSTLQSYAITAEITRDEVLPFGYKLQNTETARMWVDAPSRLRLEVKGDMKNRTYIYDGSQLTMYAPDLNVYSTTAAPGNLRELVRTLLAAGVEIPLIDMLYQGAMGSLTEDVRVGILVGESQVDGVPTDHLAFRQPAVDWQLWVEKGRQSLPRKLLITTRYEVGDPQYQAVLRWDTKPSMPATSFQFTPPAGATKIPYRTQLVADGGDK